jgi:dienelactone hydrolase
VQQILVSRFQIVLPVVLLCSLGLSGCLTSQPAGDRWMASGPHEVSYNAAVSLYDSQQEREVIVQVSWPQTGKNLPVVVFSHGAFCYPQNYRSVTDHWVSHGYVVIAPNHLDSPNGGKIRPADIPVLQESRVRDMSFVLDALPELEQQLPELAGRLDRQRFAVAGHSFGGMIAMIKSGLYMQTGSGEPVTGYADPRFKAALVMSGVGLVPAMPNLPNQAYMTDDAFAGLTGPLLASGGTLDEGNVGTGVTYPWQWRMAPYTLAPPGDKYSLVIDRADHYLGGQICRADRGGPDDPEAAMLVRTTQIAFLDAYLKGDSRARRWLESDGLQQLSGTRANIEFK